MVDEAAYRRTRDQVLVLPCVFQGALLARQAECALAGKQALAEREVLACSQATAHINCEMLERLFLERATFPLHLRPMQPLTHATVQRLQCGGLSGLRVALATEERDVHQLVVQGQELHGSLTALPWDRIVSEILAWRPRRRSGLSDPQM